MKLILIYKTIVILSFGYIFYWLGLIYIYYRLYKKYKTVNTNYILYIFTKKYIISHIYEYIACVFFLIITIYVFKVYLPYTNFIKIAKWLKTYFFS